MKKIVIIGTVGLILILLCTSLFYVNNQKRQISSLNEKLNKVNKSSHNVVLIGSSVTQGLGASAPEKSWAGLLFKFLNENNTNMKFINLGVNGYTTQLVINNTLKITENLNSENFTPDVIIFELCTINDFFKLPYTDSQRNVNIILDRLKKQFPKAKIYVMPPNQVTIFNKEINKEGLSYSQYVANLENNIKSQNYTYIDFWDDYNKDLAKHGLKLKDTLSKDGKHPNNAGYTIWFNSIKNEFRYLKQ